MFLLEGLNGLEISGDQTTNLFELNFLVIKTTKDHDDIEYFTRFYSKISNINILVINSDEAPETYPPKSLLQTVNQLRISGSCYSFETGNIQEQLKQLTNVGVIGIFLFPGGIGETAMVELAKLNTNSEKGLKFIVRWTEMADSFSKTLTDANVSKRIEIADLNTGKSAVLNGTQ